MSEKKKRLSVIEQLAAGAKQTEESLAPVSKPSTGGGGFRFDTTATKGDVDPSRILFVNPADCHPFKYNDRQYTALTQADVQELIDGFQQSGVGQLEACIARKTDQGKYEIIAGTRRLKAATWIVENANPNFKLQIVLKNIANDIQALQIMQEENKYTKPSAYERAMSARIQIDELFAGNQSEYSRVMNIAHNTVSEWMAFTQIPDMLLDAYGDRRIIPINHATKYRALLEKHAKTPSWKKALLTKAEELKSNPDTKLQTPAQIQSALLRVADVTLRKASKPKQTEYAIGTVKKAIVVTQHHDGRLVIAMDPVCQEYRDQTLAKVMEVIKEK